MGPDLFGDKVRLADGELGFELADIALPGNNGLEVKLTRSYQVMSRKTYVPDAMLADWQINVPNISGSFAPDWGVGSDVAHAIRCENGWPPDVPFRFETREFWTGLRVEIPDGGRAVTHSGRPCATCQAVADKLGVVTASPPLKP